MIVVSEDRLLQAIAVRMLGDLGVDVGTCALVCPGGGSKVESRLPALVRTALGGVKVLVATDLDALVCPVVLRDRWFPNGVPGRLLFSVAVREADAWLLADSALPYFLKSTARVPVNPDGVRDAKAALLSIARSSRSREIREEMIAGSGALSRIGPGYNSLLGRFVASTWNYEAASDQSPSLARFKRRLSEWALA